MSPIHAVTIYAVTIYTASARRKLIERDEA